MSYSSGERMSGEPVIIRPYDPTWPAKFEIEKRVLTAVLAPWLLGPIEHIGSTAVPGLSAKPVIDIMGPVRDLPSSKPAIEALRPLSYCYFAYKPDRMHWFCKPSPLNRTHHLHLVPFESQVWREQLAFRDCLRSDAATREAYTQLKLKLAAQFRNDREAYTEAKTEFIQAVVERVSR
jgi:GrpB-like predicted nucleotidyltransferase (UPF0157 family)